VYHGTRRWRIGDQPPKLSEVALKFAAAHWPVVPIAAARNKPKS
jgi:hypothetical protein